MRKLLVCTSAYLMLSFSSFITTAGTPGVVNEEVRVQEYFNSIYKGIDFSSCNTLSFEVFAKAYKGYLNLKNEGKLSNDKEIISICDFNLPSTEKRLWIIDLSSGKVLFNTYVAHGQGSGGDYAESFSNSVDSHQSSLGFYVTGDTYNGDHGLSLRLSGMDNGFNDAAMDRGIVVHGANYVSDKFIAGNVHLGRSWGCPAVPDKLKIPIIKTIEGGTCLFIYHEDNHYLRSAYWLNKKIDHLPENSMFADMMKINSKPKRANYQIIQYMHGNRIDSVKTVAIDQLAN